MRGYHDKSAVLLNASAHAGSRHSGGDRHQAEHRRDYQPHLLAGQQQAGTGAVVEIDVRHLGAVWQRRRIHCVVVVLRADLDAACTAIPGQAPSAFAGEPGAGVAQCVEAHSVFQQRVTRSQP